MSRSHDSAAYCPSRPIGGALVCLFAFSLLCGCGGGIPPEQKDAMMRIRDLGAKINLKDGGYEVDFRGTAVEDSDLVHLKKIPHLRDVNLQGTRVTDAGLEHLQGIETLEFLYLQRTMATSAKVTELKQKLKAEVNF
jgi:hypothetical protein